MTKNELSIGELARRVGINSDLLRAWERRYGLLWPERTSGGHRRYSADDEARVRRMQTHLASGAALEVAASHTLSEEDEPTPEPAKPMLELTEQGAELTQALDALDDARSQVALDKLLARHRLEDVLTGAILPYLHALGARWQRGEASIAMEHFASALIRGRLLALARGWDQGAGPRVVLACPRGELHEIALIALGLMLRERGWRLTYLGADVGLETIRAACAALASDAVVIAATQQGSFEHALDDIRSLARREMVFLAGPAATSRAAATMRARVLIGDPVAAAARLTELARAGELAS